MLPDEQYLQGLGKATYCIAYAEWLVMEAVQRLDRSVDASWLAPKTMGTIASRFVAAVELAELDAQLKSELSVIAEEWRSLVSPRNDIAHARPAADAAGRQRLYRWAPGVDIRFITDEVLADVADRALLVAERLSPLRARLPPP